MKNENPSLRVCNNSNCSVAPGGLIQSATAYSKRLDLFAKAQTSCGSEATTNAESMLAVTLAKQLRVLQNKLDRYRKRITELFEEHPDYVLFGSLPGGGQKLAARLLAELGDHRDRFESTDALRCYAGTATGGSVKPRRAARAARCEGSTSAARAIRVCGTRFTYGCTSVGSSAPGLSSTAQSCSPSTT